MKIVWIANDIDSVKSPIGRYVGKLIDVIYDISSNVEITAQNGSTAEYGRIRRCLSFEMTRAILRSASCVRRDGADAVVVEYPFVEYNPCIIIAYYALRWIARKKKCTVVLSVHEYLRAKSIRKAVVRSLARASDVVFVTDPETKEALKETNENIHMRNIFSPISVTWEAKEEKSYNGEFIYFGVVNSSKAFREMLDAFSAFNKDRTKKLTVYTSTDVKDLEIPDGVSICNNRTDQEIEEALKRATYCILPILPEVGINNSTLLGAAQAGCTVIGRFSSALQGKSYIVNVSDYGVRPFADGMERAYAMDIERLKRNCDEAMGFGALYTAENTAKDMMRVICKKEQFS